jgi:hypothetical protein
MNPKHASAFVLLAIEAGKITCTMEMELFIASEKVSFINSISHFFSFNLTFH